MRISTDLAGFYSTLFKPGGNHGESNPTAVLPLGGAGSSTPFTRERQAAAASFRFMQISSPNTELRSASPASALSVQNADAELKKTPNVNIVEQAIKFNDRNLQNEKKYFDDLAGYLSTIRDRAASLASNGVNNRIAKTVGTGLADVTADSTAATGSYYITVNSLPVQHEVGSSAGLDPNAQLGLSGTIKVNGQVITVVSTDAMATIAQKINQGEDVNYNGILDPAEDLNLNGTIDSVLVPGVYTGKGYTKPFYYNEDLNGNRTLDGAEDLNGTERLDGGTKDTGARAFIYNGRLIIASNHTAEIDLSLVDPDRILQSIGIIYFDSERGSIETTTTNFGTENAAPGTITVDGTSYDFNDPDITGLIAGVTISVRTTGTDTIKVENDPGQAAEPVLNLVSDYNDALAFMNSVMTSRNSISSNLRVKEIYSDTVKGFLSKLGSQTGATGSLLDIGIIPKNSVPTAIDQTVIENLQNGSGQLSIPGRGNLSLKDQADGMGINSADNLKVVVDRGTLEKKLTNDFTATVDMLRVAASRMQSNIDFHTKPNYGTLAGQKLVDDYYMKNKGAVQNYGEAAKQSIQARKDLGVFSSFGQ